MRTITFALLAVGVAVTAGCLKTDQAHFRSNLMYMEMRNVSGPEDMIENADDEKPISHQTEIATILQAMFGTPDEPVVLPETGLDKQLVERAAGPVMTDDQGREFGLYRRHCAHCHGVTGDGHGTTAQFLNPYPRDYRQGKFKFKSTRLSAKPTHADLERILIEGIPGTAMPSFRLLTSAEIDALVEYVKYLSIRGEMEIRMIDFAGLQLDPDQPFPTDSETLIDNMLDRRIVSSWEKAEDEVIHPEPEFLPPENRSESEVIASIEAGKKLFYGKRANCFTCHGPSALGDGQTNIYDDWNKATQEYADAVEAARQDFEDNHDERIAEADEKIDDLEDSMDGKDKAEVAALKKDLEKAEMRLAQLRTVPASLHRKEVVLAHQLAVRPVRPRNLRMNVFRGGRRPLDIYRKLYTGINGVGMPGAGPASPGAKGTLSPEEMWQLVDYVLALPLEAESQPPEPLITRSRERL